MAKMTDHEVSIYNEGYRNGLQHAQQEADRDSFAMAALTGICMFTNAAPGVAKTAYAIADAMLAEREQPARTRDSV